ncbi:hypothetical protein D9M69_614830 [compost metagenome]
MGRMRRPVEIHEAYRCHRLCIVHQCEPVVTAIDQTLMQPGPEVLGHHPQLRWNASRFEEHGFAMYANHLKVIQLQPTCLQT